MNQASVDITRFVIRLFDIRLHVIEKTYVASLVALNDFRRLFIDNQKMVVFE